jgi:hypothetical protein
MLKSMLSHRHTVNDPRVSKYPPIFLMSFLEMMNNGDDSTLWEDLNTFSPCGKLT